MEPLLPPGDPATAQSAEKVGTKPGRFLRTFVSDAGNIQGGNMELARRKTLELPVLHVPEDALTRAIANANATIPVAPPAPVAPPPAAPPPIAPLPRRIDSGPTFTPQAVKPPTIKQQSWGTVISIIIIMLMVVVGAFYTWGKKIAEERAAFDQYTATTTSAAQ